MGKRKLTPKDEQEIIELYRDGKGASKNLLAMRYGVTRATILYVVNPEARAKQRKYQREYQANKLNELNEDN